MVDSSMRRWRKTRFVIVSDTHNATANGSFKLPKGDVLVHAGDLTNQGSFKELDKSVRWIEAADFESKIVIAGKDWPLLTTLNMRVYTKFSEGNHDITLDSQFYAQYGLYFHNQEPQDVQKCQALLDESQSILYLRNESAIVQLTDPAGPKTTFKVFGSPCSPANGMWAFGYKPEEADIIWDKIPLDTDVLITHTPSKFHLDERSDRRSVGCESLRHALWRVRPRLAVCGHVHESRGAEVVQWDLGCTNVKYKEAGVTRWNDPGKGNDKQSLLDLSRKSGKPLMNDGSVGHEPLASSRSEADELVAQGDRNLGMDVTFSGASILAGPSETSANSKSILNGLSQVTNDFLSLPIASAQTAVRGQGGQPPSKRCDLAALNGRLGRLETAIVNAAMMASSWPHKGTGGKKFNKPMVVDLELPVWEGDE